VSRHYVLVLSEFLVGTGGTVAAFALSRFSLLLDFHGQRSCSTPADFVMLMNHCEALGTVLVSQAQSMYEWGGCTGRLSCEQALCSCLV
jgi:hypothetical protein